MLIMVLFIFISEFKFPLLVLTKLISLKLKLEFEKKINKKSKKYKPPIHCDEDLHIINVGSIYLILLKMEKPVPVIPEKDSNNELIKLIL